MKDNFSLQPDRYFKFRPSYPQALYDFLVSLVGEKQAAWDCGTGNGQAAQELSKYFDTVYATDISENQIQHAVQKENILYKMMPAEQTSFPGGLFDLVTVAQAVHWFDFDLFYKEVKRTIKPGGIIAVFGYGLMQTGDDTDKVFRHFYNNIVGPYWDKERKYLDEHYQTIPFPFEEIVPPALNIIGDWSFDQLTGYLGTWSAVQHYIKANNKNPIDMIHDELLQSWGSASTKKITFRIVLRVGRVLK